MAWGISPRKIAIIPLGEYNADHYLTLLYHAFENLGWHIGYFDRDGIIGYTNISWQSYSEEVSVRIINNKAIIKSECVGFQLFFTDYGKNEKNVELLLGEIEYVEFHLQHTLTETTQQLMDSVPENQFINLADPPMGAKEKLLHFGDVFTPAKNYRVTPILVIVNAALFIITKIALIVMVVVLALKHNGNASHSMQDIYLNLGFSARAEVLNGEVWRLISNTFLHFTFMHVAGNMVVLIYIGSMLEGKLGKWNYLLLYLFTGICASITSVIWHDNAIAAGASGAIFGMFGIILALLSTDFYENNARRALLISTGMFMVINVLQFNRQVDYPAHIGGLVSGYLFGWLAYWGMKFKRQQFIAASTLAITLVFTGLCIVFAPRYDFKTADTLMDQLPKIVDSLNNDFYGDGNRQLADTARIKHLQQYALPRINKLKLVAQQLQQVPLSKKRRELADVRLKMALQQALIFELLYKEVRDKNYIKYRPPIITASENLNLLRTEYSRLLRDNE
jgi:rhomboid protease GluP